MPDFIMHIKSGSITNRKKAAEVFNGLKDGKYLVKIEAFKKRSLNQNAYYHGCVVPIVKDALNAAGFDEVKTNADAHEIMKHLFLKKKIVNHNTDDVIEIAGSTAKLTTIEFNAFIDDIIRWGSEYLGIQIPLPNESLVMFADYDTEVNATIITPETL